jgi:hypothetical protein
MMPQTQTPSPELGSYYVWFYNGHPCTGYRQLPHGYPGAPAPGDERFETFPITDVPADTYQADIALLAWLLAEAKWEMLILAQRAGAFH